MKLPSKPVFKSIDQLRCATWQITSRNFLSKSFFVRNCPSVPSIDYISFPTGICFAKNGSTFLLFIHHYLRIIILPRSTSLWMFRNERVIEMNWNDWVFEQTSTLVYLEKYVLYLNGVYYQTSLHVQFARKHISSTYHTEII